MDLEEIAGNEIDINLLKELSPFINTYNIIHKFKKYYGKRPTESDFYKVYSKYVRCNSQYGKVFSLSGKIKRQVFCSLNSPKFELDQFKALEGYLFCKKIIQEKLFG